MKSPTVSNVGSTEKKDKTVKNGPRFRPTSLVAELAGEVRPVPKDGTLSNSVEGVHDFLESKR